MDKEKYESQKRTALNVLSRHDHGARPSADAREGCGACCLNGYHPKGERKDFINYAGWARLYIQAGKFIPKNIRFHFMAELASDNRAYADALVEDIRAYGINVEPGEFKNAVRDVLGIE